MLLSVMLLAELTIAALAVRARAILTLAVSPSNFLLTGAASLFAFRNAVERSWMIPQFCIFLHATSPSQRETNCDGLFNFVGIRLHCDFCDKRSFFARPVMNEFDATQGGHWYGFNGVHRFSKVL